MQLSIYKDYEELSHYAAAAIIDFVKTNPLAVLCFATGDSPRLTYKLIVEAAQAKKVDFSKCSFTALDEWVGISPENEGSCHHFLETNIFKPLQIEAANIHLFDALSDDLANECRKMDQLIQEKGGIDLMLVGVGMNGHIGFNEPGTLIDQYSHVVNLDDTTQKVGQKYFKEATQLKQGITLGLKHFLQSKKTIMLASDSKKAGIMKQVIKGEISTAVPASVIRMHLNAEIMIDEEAAALL
ncbi:MAG: glucosamine-6-phosphate deaminase [Ferruginibacter sp.]